MQQGTAPESAGKPPPELDRTAIRDLLKLTPLERLQLAADEANNLGELLGVARSDRSRD